MYSYLKTLLPLRNHSFLQISRSISLFNKPLFFQSTPALYAEPLKKKKKLDPAILRQREEKRKKKMEKQIRKLEKNSKQLKPIDEVDTPLEIRNSIKERSRPETQLSEEVLEERILLIKSWTTYKTKQHLQNLKNIDCVVFSQQKALDELRKESEDLYQEAIQIDTTLIPFYTKGPSYTPPIKDYYTPDGEYQDVSKKWDD